MKHSISNNRGFFLVPARERKCLQSSSLRIGLLDN